MVAVIGSLQRYFLPVLIIGFCTGLLALIPMVGWLLGASVFLLASQYTERRSVAIDLIVTALLWVIVRQGAVLIQLT